MKATTPQSRLGGVYYDALRGCFRSITTGDPTTCQQEVRLDRGRLRVGRKPASSDKSEAVYRDQDLGRLTTLEKRIESFDKMGGEPPKVARYYDLRTQERFGPRVELWHDLPPKGTVVSFADRPQGYECWEIAKIGLTPKGHYILGLQPAGLHESMTMDVWCEEVSKGTGWEVRQVRVREGSERGGEIEPRQHFAFLIDGDVVDPLHFNFADQLKEESKGRDIWGDMDDAVWYVRRMMELTGWKPEPKRN